MTIALKDDTKARWDELQPEDKTHDEFAQRLLDAYEAGEEPVVIDGDDIRNELEHFAGNVEVAAYRGAKDALE